MLHGKAGTFRDNPGSECTTRMSAAWGDVVEDAAGLLWLVRNDVKRRGDWRVLRSRSSTR
jgi:hypothetical protein